MKTAEGELLWSPSQEWREATNMARYIAWLDGRGELSTQSYDSLWTWSIKDVSRFWATIWEFGQVRAASPYRSILSGGQMPDVRWLDGARLNFAEHLFRNRTPFRPAVLWRTESSELAALSWDEVAARTGALAASLRELGVRRGDRVIALMPNIPETLIAFLATASLGAIWSACSPDFGTSTLVDRFAQIEPKILVSVDEYEYKGKWYDLSEKLRVLRAALPSLTHTIVAPYPGRGGEHGVPRGVKLWEEVTSTPAALEFDQVEASHPLWIVFTSGTSGLPKPIVHGHGGVLLERLKAVLLHADVRPDDIYFWYTTTSWVMWNVTVSALLGCSTIVLYDGSPLYPNHDTLWSLAEESGASIFGTSASFLQECMRAGLRPIDAHDLSKLRSIGATASPLSPEGFKWVYQFVKDDVWLASASGGTDVATGFVVGCPLLPVHAGEIQCRALGVDVGAADERGEPVVGEVGELVVRQPMPSMPLRFWNDPADQRYRESYFARFAGMWCHGDWLKITPRGTAVIYGRSDSTINRHGIRVGTSDIYRVVEQTEGVVDSLVVEVESPPGASEVLLFVVVKDELDDRMIANLRTSIIDGVSPRHAPDRIIAVPEIPRTLNGKKVEVPVKRILEGAPVESAVARGALANPSSLDHFIAFRRTA